MSWRTFWIAPSNVDGALNILTAQGWQIIVIAPYIKDNELRVFIAAYLPPISPRERFGVERKDIDIGVFQ